MPAKKDSLARSFLWISLTLFLWPPGSHACNVPVFRYALERWAADSYRISVFRDGPFDSGSQKAYDLLRAAPLDSDSPANLALTTVDVASEAGRRILEQYEVPQLPWMVVHFPLPDHVEDTLWSGPLSVQNVQHLLYSPARAELAKRLLQGEVGVWILLESGDAAADERAAATLQAELRRLSRQLKVPQTGLDEKGNLIRASGFEDYAVRFSMLRISRRDPDEEILVNTLLRSEPDLIYYSEPMAFPVFGKARALYALAGSGINEKLIAEGCSSLVRWCSCEIKAQNPGTDLFVSADWSSPAGGAMVKDDPLPPLAGLTGFMETTPEAPEEESHAVAGQPETPPVNAESPPPGSAEGENPPAALAPVGESSAVLVRNLFLVLILGASIVAGLTVSIMQRKRRP